MDAQKTDGRYVVISINPGCDCCSYRIVDTYATLKEIPDCFKTSDYEIEFEADDE